MSSVISQANVFVLLLDYQAAEVLVNISAVNTGEVSSKISICITSQAVVNNNALPPPESYIEFNKHLMPSEVHERGLMSVKPGDAVYVKADSDFVSFRENIQNNTLGGTSTSASSVMIQW